MMLLENLSFNDPTTLPKPSTSDSILTINKLVPSLNTTRRRAYAQSLSRSLSTVMRLIRLARARRFGLVSMPLKHPRLFGVIYKRFSTLPNNKRSKGNAIEADRNLSE